MERGAELICVFEFDGNERTLTTVLCMGELRRFSLPGTITWPDGSQSNSVDILISQKTLDAVDCLPSEPIDIGMPQPVVDRPGG